MSAKPKAKATFEIDNTAMLAEPAATVATEAPVRLNWPASTETRELETELNDDQIIERGRLLVDHLRKADSLANQKKASADHFKALIEAEEETIEALSIIVKAGKDRCQVPCHWVFQANGPDKELIGFAYHSELKTLVRDDTGAVVEIKPITPEDRQINLPLGDEEAHQVNMQAITDAGYTLVETPEGHENPSPFILTAPGGEVCGFEADSIADAAVEAVKIAQTGWPKMQTEKDPAE